MKTKIFLIIMTAFLMVGTAMAQQRPRGERREMNPKERAERMTERMVKEYNLDDAQKQQLLELNTQRAEQMGERPQTGNRREMGQRRERNRQEPTEEQRAEMKARMKKMQAEQKAYDEKLQQILTKEQYEAYTKKMQERKDNMGRRGRPGRR